jgi:hypothetical protein
MTQTQLTLAQAHNLARVLNEVVNAIPDDVLPPEIRAGERAADELWRRLSTIDDSVALEEDDVVLAIAAIDAAVRILGEQEFATRTGLDVGDARNLAHLMQAR